ncbi:SCO family protein [Roseateles sp. DXS20W]|uniref:SCO family protein n=1 Tax=Pelomonas lactea TaxID=3299030 RepID=UPI0037480CE3
MSGSNSSAPGSAASTPEPLSFAVHSLPDPRAAAQKAGRWKMLLVLALCAAPVVASYFTFYVIKPSGSAYGELITPTVDVPADLPLTDLQGQAVKAESLKGQWLLVAVQPSRCDAACERQLFVQRQLREMLGKERARVDKLWLIPDEGTPRAEVLAAVGQKGAEVTVLRVPADRLAGWLKPAQGRKLSEHFYVVDPMGRWMERAPGEPEPKKLQADLVKLLKASAGWDNPGR